MRGKNRFQKGYTLIEILIVVTLMAIIIAIALPLFYRTLQKYRAETAVEQVAINLRFARLSAVKKRINYKVVFFDKSSSPTPPDVANSYKLQWNPSKDTTTYVNYTYANTQLPSNLSILGGGISEIVFSPRGSASITGGTNVRIQSMDWGSGDTRNIIYRIDVTGAGGITKTAE